MKRVAKYLGLIIITVTMIAGIYHRFTYPDMTTARWLLEFWYVWLAWFGFSLLGGILYSHGNK